MSLWLSQNSFKFYKLHTSIYQWWNCGNDQSVLAEIFGTKCRFLPSCPKSCSFCPRNLWGYWTNLDQICTVCRKNVAIEMTEYFWIGIAIIESISESQRVKWRLVRQICQKLVAMATSLKESRKKSVSIKSRKYLPFGEKMVKICPVVSRCWDIFSWFKKRNYGRWNI